ncbi:MAG TPA: PQQ-binding-like beta-propeller repeat protein [Micropepsaceae bacterium]|nr:PQQ-binding-like beta-propeller repeat protein [Micropepsaceae bacterium]
MRYPFRASLLCTVLVCAAGPAGYAAQAPTAPAAPAAANTLTLKPVANFVPVTDAMMRAPKPEDWLMYRGNYAGWAYSPLDKINKTNVKNLQLVWSRAMAPGDNEITPIVYNGVMYIANPNDVIQAIDATTGDLLWEYKHPLPAREQLHNHQGEHKRSLALYGNFIIFVSFDNIVVGLDARTGQRAWQQPRGGDGYVTNSSGVLVANGMVVAGSTANGYGGGYVSGHDAKNGEELWRKELIPHPGEPGDETWAGTPFENRWHTGVWGHITYDPDLDLVYYGSSGVAPASEAQRKAPGATLAGTDTRFAVHPKTGEIVWRHQTMPRDNWDQECTFEMMVINTPVNPDAGATGMMSINPDARKGPRKTLTGIPCKTGIAWSFDAANGEFLWAKQTVEQNLVTNIGPKGQVTVNEDMVMKDVTKTYNICPTYAGGRDWPMGAYNPKSNVFFVPMTNLCIAVKAKPDTPTPAQGYNTSSVGRFATGKDKVGRIDAISAETGKTMWSWETRVSNYSPLLATGSGLLFNGGLDRYLRALDADSGQVIWQSRLPSQTVGGAITYSVNGRQYVAISAGGGALAGLQVGMTKEADMTSGSNAVYVFALPQ